MEVEQTQSFNQKLSQWIASQGFWFQLRYSIGSGGGWSMTISHLVRLGFKAGIVLLVAAAGFGIYLVKRVDSKAFADALDAGVIRGLGAADAEIVDFSRVQGDAQIRRVIMEGGDSSYFRSLDAGNVRFRMGLLAGMAGPWDAGSLNAKWMEIDLKAGADTPEAAKALGESFFREWEGFRFSSVQVDEATLGWGFSQRTAGRIDKSSLVATRSTGNWRLVFKGGTFSQNWFKKLEIVEMVAECTPAGMKITKGEFKCGDGKVVFKGVAVAGGDKPEVSGTVEITRVELAKLVPESVETLVEGVVSGSFALSGSTNSKDGIQFEGDVTLGAENKISLRDKIHLLKCLSVVDVFNSYKKVDFDRGSFHLKTVGGSMKLSRVDLKAGELMTARGELEVRFPREDEVAGPERTNLPASFAPVFNPGLSVGQRAKGKEGEPALGKEPKPAGAAESKDMAIFERGAQRRINEVLLQQEMARRAQALRCDGGFSITLSGDAFDSSDKLREIHPVDPGTGRIAMEVPLRGALNQVTKRQAEELEKLGAKHAD